MYKWPAIAAAVFFIGYFGSLAASEVSDNNSETKVKVEVVRQCAHQPNPSLCAANISKALDEIK